MTGMPLLLAILEILLHLRRKLEGTMRAMKSSEAFSLILDTVPRTNSSTLYLIFECLIITFAAIGGSFALSLYLSTIQRVSETLVPVFCACQA